LTLGTGFALGSLSAPFSLGAARPGGARRPDFPFAVGAHDAKQRLALLAALAATHEADKPFTGFLLLDADVDRSERARGRRRGSGRESREKDEDDCRDGQAAAWSLIEHAANIGGFVSWLDRRPIESCFPG
jgi:hypothetical protein